MLLSLDLFVLMELPPTMEKKKEEKKGGKTIKMGKGFLLFPFFPFFFPFFFFISPLH